MKYLNILAILIIGVSISLISSCKKDDTGPQYTESVMLIDSITYPDTVAFGGKLPIQFYGVIGDGCDYFSRFEEVELDETDPANTFKIRIYRKTEEGVNCTEQVKYLEDAIINLTGMAAGNFYIKVVQPNGSFLEGLVFIEE
ncbi:MAG: hypothetical protein C0595_09800 [Marinilabiliales bacterium]|nr:MAG: hypothetical protein C0595_09800 [Marinilabiliales bacterium]